VYKKPERKMVKQMTVNATLRSLSSTCTSNKHAVTPLRRGASSAVPSADCSGSEQACWQLGMGLRAARTLRDTLARGGRGGATHVGIESACRQVPYPPQQERGLGFLLAVGLHRAALRSVLSRASLRRSRSSAHVRFRKISTQIYIENVVCSWGICKIAEFWAKFAVGMSRKKRFVGKKDPAGTCSF